MKHPKIKLTKPPEVHITDAQLSAWEEALKSVPTGPWEIRSHTYDGGRRGASTTHYVSSMTEHVDNDPEEELALIMSTSQLNVARYVAMSRIALEELIAEVRRLRSQELQSLG
jgi:hypothetical protein